jgi:hypothetical protein
MYGRVQNDLMEQSGIGDYEKTGNWQWEYYPPPYDFLRPADSVAMPPPVLGGASVVPRSPGLSCGGGCSCGGTCGGGKGHSHGTAGLGLFDSMDWTTWGVGEWTCIGVGAYVLLSIIGDTKRTVTRTKKAARAFKSKV